MHFTTDPNRAARGCPGPQASSYSHINCLRAGEVGFSYLGQRHPTCYQAPVEVGPGIGAQYAVGVPETPLELAVNPPSGPVVCQTKPCDCVPTTDDAALRHGSRLLAKLAIHRIPRSYTDIAINVAILTRANLINLNGAKT